MSCPVHVTTGVPSFDPSIHALVWHAPALQIADDVKRLLKIAVENKNAKLNFSHF